MKIIMMAMMTTLASIHPIMAARFVGSSASLLCGFVL
jgi:hypothetical protein